MDHEKPTVSFGDQSNELRRRLWQQFVQTLDPHQRKHFHKLLAPRSRKRVEKALTNLVDVLDKVDRLVAATEPPSKN